MLPIVRNQVRRHILSSRYGRAVSLSRGTAPAPAPGIAVEEGGALVDGRRGELDRGVLNVRKLGEGPLNLNYGFRRNFLSSRETYSKSTPLSPKSIAAEVPPDESFSYEVGRFSGFRRYLPDLPFSANYHGGAERGVHYRIVSTFWQKILKAAGVIAAAAVMLVASVAALRYEEGSPTRPQELLLSTWSILWDSLDEFKDNMTILFRAGVSDVVDAATAAGVLARCLMSVLLTVGEEPTVGLSSWLMPGVAALIADLAAHEYRRKAVVEAGGGRVVDWLLKAVGMVDDGVTPATQAEASRALAHLLSDENTCEGVLSRPHALPYLFQFASALHVEQGLRDWSKVHNGHAESGSYPGRSMLVTAIVDLIMSSCDVEDGSKVTPRLPGNADPADIAAALQVIKDGGWLSDDQDKNEGDSGEKAGKDKGGVHGIGIRVMGGTGIVGVQRLFSKSFLGNAGYPPIQPLNHTQGEQVFDARQGTNASRVFNDIHRKQDWGVQSTAFAEYSHDEYGLWDDLHGRHITVPLAAWALATWARSSNANRAKIAELDEDGDGLLVAVLAPEKTVKWHGAMAMRSLLASKSYSLAPDVATRWSSALLNVASQASRLKDPTLTHCALAALTNCVSKSKSAHSIVLKEGLPVMREIASDSESDILVQGALAQVLDVLTDKGELLPDDESKKWAAILLKWVCSSASDNITRSCGSRVLDRVVNDLGPRGIPISQAWLAMLLMDVISNGKLASAKGKRPANVIAEAKEQERLQNQAIQKAIVAAAQLAKVVAQEAAYRTQAETSNAKVEVAQSAAELPMIDLLGLDVLGNTSKRASKEALPKVSAAEAGVAVQKAIKALAEVTADDPVWRQRILEAGGLSLLRRLLLCNDYEQWAASEASEVFSSTQGVEQTETAVPQKKGQDKVDVASSVCPHIRKHAARLLSILTLQPSASAVIAGDKVWVRWLEDCANGKIAGSNDIKMRSYALTSLLNLSSAQRGKKNPRLQDRNGNPRVKPRKDLGNDFWPRYEDAIFIVNIDSPMYKRKLEALDENKNTELWNDSRSLSSGSVQTSQPSHDLASLPPDGVEQLGKEMLELEPVMDVVFVHGLRGGAFKTWRLADTKASTRTQLVERIDVEAGKKGTCWPEQWLAGDLPRSRLLSIKYRTNLTEWAGATLPLEEVSSILLDKLLAAGVGERPLVFVTHSMGGLVVKQMLLQAAQDKSLAHLLNHTTGIIFYSCPHFGSKLADMPWRIGYVFRPAPTIGELRSGSPRLEELNRCLRQLHKEGHVDVLSFSETTVTPLVEGYGGWGLRLEIVPIESAYPGFGELVVLQGTDHVNSCKPLDRTDPAYSKTLEFLQNLESYAVGVSEHD